MDINMIIAIILAAGGSTRMGKQKLLLELEGISIIQRVAGEVVISNCFDEIVFVYHEEAVKNAVSDYTLSLAYNPNPQLGLSSSIKAGISKAGDTADAYMFFMGDQPFINEALINKLIDEYKKDQKSIIVPVYNGNKGMPTIFSSKWRNDFNNIEGDVGGRVIIQRNAEQAVFVAIDDTAYGMDVDTKEAYSEAVKLSKNRL